ncbi:hypothetical protein JCM10213_000004 [Rhodosporidiobolus nylandii]
MSHAYHGASQSSPSASLSPASATPPSGSLPPTFSSSAALSSAVLAPRAATPPPPENASPDNLATRSTTPQRRVPAQEEEDRKNGVEKWEKIVPPRLAWWLEEFNKSSTQPRVSREVLPILDLLAAQEDPAELERLKRMHERDEAELARESEDVWDDIRKGKVRRRKDWRWRENLCIREYWERYVQFENEHGVKSEQRIRARLERFADNWFPTLSDRNEAERLLDYPEGQD